MSLWRHFYNREETASQLTQSMIEWQEKWRWDFVKINPAACYHVLDWNAEYRFFDDESREPELVRTAVDSADDIEKIQVLNPKKGHLNDQLQVIFNLREHFGPDLPIVETVFSPMETAHRLMHGREDLQMLRKKAPEAFHELLQSITQTFLLFADACMNAGADGLFFATKWASTDWMTWAEYEEFGKPYDLQILNAMSAREAMLMLHVCGERTHLLKMLDYPVDIFSYDFFADGAPSPHQVAGQTGKFILGGISPEKMESGVDGVIEDCRASVKFPDGWQALRAFFPTESMTTRSSN